MGLYLCLAEILVGTTGVPSEKTTARANKKGFVPINNFGLIKHSGDFLH
jgi:hypothetical protein